MLTILFMIVGKHMSYLDIDTKEETALNPCYIPA